MSSEVGGAASSAGTQLFGARTLFHLHTDWTDGDLTFEQYFDFAAAHRVDRLVFLEHIRRNPTYDPAEFERQVIAWRDRTGIPAFVGFEAKVLAGGALDISDDALSRAAVVGIAEHGKELDFDQFRDSFRRILATYPARHSSVRFVWVHPGLLLHRLGALERHRADHVELLHEAVGAGVRIERNLRYDLVSLERFAEASSMQPVLGADAHTHADLARWLQAVEGSP